MYKYLLNVILTAQCHNSVPYTKDNSQLSPYTEECCAEKTPMQVDPSPMNVGDGGTVSRGSCVPTEVLESMVGNPQQTLPPDLRGDVPHSKQTNLRTSTDCKMPSACAEMSKASKTSNSNHCPEVTPSHSLNNTSVFNTNSLSMPLSDRAEISKTKADGAVVCHTHNWPYGKKAMAEDLVNLIHSGVTPNKKALHSTGTTQPVISLPTAFQCSAVFKPGQPVAFLPSASFSSPLCKITLPPGLGQIAALREATASQFQKDCPVPSSGPTITPRFKSNPYQFSVGRDIAHEKKPLSSGRSDYISNVKDCKSVGEHKPTVPAAASTAIALPAQQAIQASAPLTHYTISPTAAICCSSALANITQSRLLSLVEKGPSRGVEKNTMSYLKPKTSSITEDHNNLCPTEVRDVPLDLSSKSKRQKSIKDSSNNPNVVAEHCAIEPHQKNILASQRPQAAKLGSAITYSFLQDTQQNGLGQRANSKLSNHSLDPNAPWGKCSLQTSLPNLPETYVGVASPILASTLCNKDGKGASFFEDIQTFAKQETISIIDQGEQLASKSKKAPLTAKGPQLYKGLKHSAGGTSLGANDLSSTPMFVTVNSQSPRKSLDGKTGIPCTAPVIKSLWKQPLSQGISMQKQQSQSQAPSTVKSNLNCGSSLFHNSELGPTKQKEIKWEKLKCPLSNLESIVKQKGLETTTLTNENYCSLSSQASRISEMDTLLDKCKSAQLRQAVCTVFTSSSTSEPHNSKPGQNSPSSDASIIKRQVIETGTVPREKFIDKEEKQFENLKSDGRQKPELSNSKKKSASSIKSGRKDSKLLQEFKENKKEQSTVYVEISAQSKLEGISIPQTTTADEVEKEKKMNGGKVEIISKRKVEVTIQKKPKKHIKGKTTETQKATLTLIKKHQMTKTATGKQSTTHKKKKDASLVMKIPLKESIWSSSEVGEKVGKGKSRVVRKERPAHSKTSCEHSPLRIAQVDTPSLSRHEFIKVSDLEEVACSRSKRGRRRTDEALLRDWSFDSPLAPPPADTPCPPPPKSPTTSVPLRRPRGRPRLNPLPEGEDTHKIQTAQRAEGKTTFSAKKRKRCNNRKYQNGEYITEKGKVTNGEQEERFGSIEDENTDVYPRLSAALQNEVSSSDLIPTKFLDTRLGITQHHDSSSIPEFDDKPPGKRKFKSKHLSDTEEQKTIKIKRYLVGKRTSSHSTDEDSPMAKKSSTLSAAPKDLLSSVSNKKGPLKCRIPEPGRPVPPEVRRLIVNKNAGETLLQRAARLGYQEVVLYCLEKDVREVNRQDNAGYTALHEACARGCTQIVELLLKHGADVNCSAQDGTRPIHDAVAADNLATVWMLLNHGADPTLATYSGQTAIKLAQSLSMKTFLKEYFTDLEGRTDQDPSLQWDFHSSSVFESDQEACWDFLLSHPEEDGEEEQCEQRKEKDMDCLLFEFSSEPLVPCYHVQVSLLQGFCNWFFLMDVLKRLKVSARIFRARYPQFEVVSMAKAELWRQVSISQTFVSPNEPVKEKEEEGEETVELVRCVPELQGLLGSSIQLLQEDDNERSEDSSKLCSR